MDSQTGLYSNTLPCPWLTSPRRVLKERKVFKKMIMHKIHVYSIIPQCPNEALETCLLKKCKIENIIHFGPFAMLLPTWQLRGCSLKHAV